MSDEKLEKELEEYRKLAQQDKKIDVASLMINALQKHQANLLDVKQKRWAYIISLSLPPAGLFYALKFYLSDKDDGTQAAVICLALTVLSVGLFILISKSMLSSGGTSLSPTDYQQLLQ
ncbi:MAG TPA: hypothetical protein VF974_03645 [Patescibacteria group bacterium]